MVTQKQLKQNGNKPADRKFAKKIGNFARKTGKALGALFVGGSIITSLTVKGQTADSANAPAPANPQHKMELAALDNGKGKLAANTKIYPAPKIDGKDSARVAYAMDRSEKKIEPGPDPSQKWCDGIEIINDSLVFKKVDVNGRKGDAYVNIKEFLYMYALDRATTENIKWQETRIINGKKLACLVIETDDNSVLITSNPNFGTGNDTWGKGIFAKDDTRIFAHDSAKYISSDGTVLAATPTTILIIPPGEHGRLTRITLSKLVGGDAPRMQKPEIYEEAGWYVIKDPVMKNSKGEQMKVIFKIFPGEDRFESGIIAENAPPKIG